LSQIAPTGETAPGIGQFVPFLPPGPVEAGATWNQSAKLQVLGDQTVTVGAVNKLLGFTQGDSGDVAVVTSVVTMPVSLSFPVADFAEMASSNPKKQEQIAASDVVLQAKGTSKVQMTSQISMETKDVISTHNSGSASLTLSASSASSGQQGQLIVHVTDSMTIDQIGTSAKSSASPKPNVSASKSPSQLFP
jgi:hypothetical protein